MGTNAIQRSVSDAAGGQPPPALTLSTIIQRFVLLVGAPAALSVARRIPGLVVDENGDVSDYNREDPLGTVTRLLDEYVAVFGEAAGGLVGQDARPALEVGALTANLSESAAEWTGPPIRLLIVDDHRIFREGLINYLDARADMTIVGQASTVSRAIELARATQPDVVLMDCVLLDGTGAEAARVISADRPAVKILFLTGYEDDERLFEAIRAGAVGYLSKVVGPSELVDTIHGVLRGEAGLSRAMARRILDEFSGLPAAGDRSEEAVRLTARETQIVQELAHGATNQEIAQHLAITENTVKKHVSNVFEKLHVRSRRDVAEYAFRRGLARRAAD